MSASIDPNSILVASEHSSLGVRPFNAACITVFAIAGLVFQLPVIYAHSGIISRPNVPVILMSLCYVYVMVSTVIAAQYWHSDKPELWWDGKGWCDLDVRIYMCASLTILCSQCAINWNIMGLLADRPRLLYGRKACIRGLVELSACLFIPIVNLAVSTFFMERRFDLYQDLGCVTATDTSVALIVVYMMWMPILGGGALFTMMLIALRFWRRGRVVAMEAVSFIPHMSRSQFLRILLFSGVVTFVFVPIILAMATINFMNISRNGVHPLAWANGKPEGWSLIGRATLEQLAAATDELEKEAIEVTFIVRYINIAIAWLLFVCYGTGTVAREAYTLALRRIFPSLKGRDERDEGSLESACGRLSSRDSELSFDLDGCEWDAELDGAKAYKEWESGYQSKVIHQERSR